MTPAEKIRLCRRARGLTQENLAEHLGVARQSVAKWEAGESLPDPDKLPRLSDALGLTLDVLLRPELALDAAERRDCGAAACSESAPGLFSGVLIKESLQDENLLDSLRIHRAELWRTQGRPRYWTALTFTSDAPDLPARLSRALKAREPEQAAWFCDFRGGGVKYVVFHGRVLRYRLGDAAGREAAVRACAEMGVPAHQTHWED